MYSYEVLVDTAKAIVGSTTPFTNNNDVRNNIRNSIQDMTPVQYILFFIILILLILLVNYIGSVLFNMSVVKIMPSVKPIDTIQFLILNIVLHMLFC